MCDTYHDCEIKNPTALIENLVDVKLRPAAAYKLQN